MTAMYSKLLLFLFFMVLPRVYDDRKPHPLHVSTTEIHFNPKTKSLEISCRIFTDDFEQILAKNYKTKIDLGRADLQKAMDVVVKKYMEAHLSYTINRKAVKANYLGFEQDHEATNVYLEIENSSEPQQVSVVNRILYDLFDDQMNILHVESKGTRRSTKTEYPLTRMELAFN